MRLAVVGWFIALILTLAGLACAMRQKVVLSAILIVTGLALGLVSGSQLD
jgi:hypothetical protein